MNALPKITGKAAPRVSVITVTYNCADVLERTLSSVAEQDDAEVEHVVVDGASTDGTRQLLERALSDRIQFVSEPDDGIYAAMNKGLRLATGDIVGFLNAGDVYADESVLAVVAKRFQLRALDVVFGDLVYFDESRPDRVVRTYDGSSFNRAALRRGIMPPHMATFVRRALLSEIGGFDERYRIAGDFECMVKLFWVCGVRFEHVPKILVRMQRGGVSNASLRNRWLVSKEIRDACREHNVPTGWFRLFSRYPGKIWESLRHGFHGRL